MNDNAAYLLLQMRQVSHQMKTLSENMKKYSSSFSEVEEVEKHANELRGASVMLDNWHEAMGKDINGKE